MHISFLLAVRQTVWSPGALNKKTGLPKQSIVLFYETIEKTTRQCIKCMKYDSFQSFENIKANRTLQKEQ